jgi:hypothetical protein
MLVNGLTSSCSSKLRNMSPTSLSVIQEVEPTARTSESMVGSQKVGTHTASLSLFAVASYTKQISSSPYGTAKYLMNNFTNKSVSRRYLLLITFPIFSFVFVWTITSSMIGWAFQVVGPGCSKKVLTPSRASFRCCSGKQKWTNLDPALNLNQLVWVECHSMLVIASWSQLHLVLLPHFPWRGFLSQCAPYALAR